MARYIRTTLTAPLVGGSQSTRYLIVDTEHTTNTPFAIAEATSVGDAEMIIGAMNAQFSEGEPE